MRKLQWDHLHRFQLVENDPDQLPLPFHAFLQSTQGACIQNQFLEQTGYTDDATVPRQALRQTRSEVKRSHRDRAGHRDRVRNLCRDPYGAVGRDHPGTVSSTNRHHSERRIDQLIPIMKMQWYRVSRWIVARKSCDRRFSIAQSVKNPNLPLLQHQLSLYRKRVETQNQYFGAKSESFLGEGTAYIAG